MRPRLVLLAVLACGAAAGFVAWLFELSWERTAALAPVIVVGTAALLGLLALWIRVAWDTLKRQRHPYRIVAIFVAAFAILFVLSFVVGPLPKE
jgi:hypothetical protein